MGKKRILGITTIRSDYDLMSSLYRRLSDDSEIELSLIVAGTHLSATYGNSIELIKKDGIRILSTFETLLDSDSLQSRLKSASLLLLSTIDLAASYSPDLIMYAGDREDTIIGALLGAYLEIPTAHFYGGDHAKDGYVDNPVRHAVSKLSTIHFVSHEQHRRRLLLLGELPDRIHVVGNIGIDNFVRHVSMPVADIKKRFSLRKGFDGFALLIFHPVSEERAQAGGYFENILRVLKVQGINAFVSVPNSDPGNRNILKIIQQYKKDDNFVFYQNLERNLFLSIYKQSRFIIGNSSSGICEAASIPIPAINVGPRQVGRLADKNVIFCGTDLVSIEKAVRKAASEGLLQKLGSLKNSYGDGKSTERAYAIIKSLIRTTKLRSLLFKKEDILELSR